MVLVVGVVVWVLGGGGGGRACSGGVGGGGRGGGTGRGVVRQVRQLRLLLNVRLKSIVPAKQAL